MCLTLIKGFDISGVGHILTAPDSLSKTGAEVLTVAVVNTYAGLTEVS